MTPIRTILADIHPKADDQPAIDRAAQLAAATGASVTLYLCDYLEPLTGGVFFHDDTVKAARDEYMRELGDWLKERARPLREQGIEVDTLVEWHSPRFEATLSRADAINADLIVRAARKRSRLDRLLLGATDWELVRRARQPLWLVKKTLDLATHQPRIVAAVDPAHPSDRKAGLDRKLVRTAQEIRSLFGGTLHLFHAYSPSAAVAPVATASHHVAMPVLRMGGEIIEELRSQREKQVRDLAEPAGIPDERVHLVAGDASSALQELVEEQDIDIVVAGAVSRSRIERLLIGNTAEAILDDVACDVVVVKPDGFGSGNERQP
jgi:universal stress protein E